MADNSPLSWMELISIVASVVSMVLGVFAIWLSLYLYRLAESASAAGKGSADKIGASVARLDVVFDKLYADTFSMMKDTVGDMRKHVWRDVSPEVVRDVASRVTERESTVAGRFTEVQEEILWLVDSGITQVMDIGDMLANRFPGQKFVEQLLLLRDSGVLVMPGREGNGLGEGIGPYDRFVRPRRKKDGQP